MKKNFTAPTLREISISEKTSILTGSDSTVRFGGSNTQAGVSHIAESKASDFQWN